MPKKKGNPVVIAAAGRMEISDPVVPLLYTPVIRHRLAALSCQPGDGEASRRDGASIAAALRGCRLFVRAVIRLDRALLMLFCIRAKYLVRKLFLLIRHSRVKRLESSNEILHMLSVRLSDLLV